MFKIIIVSVVLSSALAFIMRDEIESKKNSLYCFLQKIEVSEKILKNYPISTTQKSFCFIKKALGNVVK